MGVGLLVKFFTDVFGYPLDFWIQLDETRSYPVKLQSYLYWKIFRQKSNFKKKNLGLHAGCKPYKWFQEWVLKGFLELQQLLKMNGNRLRKAGLPEAWPPVGMHLMPWESTFEEGPGPAGTSAKVRWKQGCECSKFKNGHGIASRPFGYDQV